MKYGFCVFLLVTALIAGADETTPFASSPDIAYATFVSNPEQERFVKVLIKSIRKNGGMFRNKTIYVVTTNPREHPCDSLKSDGTVVLPLDMDRSIRDYPLAFKAFAAAQVESLVCGKVETVIWLDPGVMLLGPPDSLMVNTRYDVVLRPVTLANTIAMPPGRPPDDFWKPIYQKTKLDYQTLSSLKTLVGQTEIQPYYNCEVFSFTPDIGLAAEWAELLGALLVDDVYQKTVCTTFSRRLFLHQAVFSAVISSRITRQRIKPLCVTSSYPFTQHERLPDASKAHRLNDLKAVIFDYAWDRIPNWMERMPIEEPLRGELFDLYQQYMEIAPRIYRVEGSCNAYLVITDAGSVLIDPAGADIAPEYFRNLIVKHPLRAILLTHAHPDHSNSIARWRKGQAIPVVAQREYHRYFEYISELDGFFARRNAIWSGKQAGDTVRTSHGEQEKPSTFFADEHELHIGGLTFTMTHTPGETPDHATIFIPELQAVFVGDNYYEYFINNATFRGTMIRPVMGYIHALAAALKKSPRSFLPGHGRPLCSNSEIKREAGGLLDSLRYVYDETLKGINSGEDVYSLMQNFRLPEKYLIRPYFGKVEWTIRGIWQEYVGWFDENPATMYATPISSIYSDLTQLAGPERILAKARHYLDSKHYVQVLYLTEIVLKNDTGRQEALRIRLEALQALKNGTRNFIERIWLNHAIRSCEAGYRQTLRQMEESG